MTQLPVVMTQLPVVGVGIGLGAETSRLDMNWTMNSGKISSPITSKSQQLVSPNIYLVNSCGIMNKKYLQCGKQYYIYSEILFKSTAEIRVPRSNGWVKIGLYDFLIEIRLS